MITCEQTVVGTYAAGKKTFAFDTKYHGSVVFDACSSQVCPSRAPTVHHAMLTAGLPLYFLCGSILITMFSMIMRDNARTGIYDF